MRAHVQNGADLYVDLYVQDAQVHHLGARPPCQSDAARWRRHPSPAAYLLHTQWRRVSSPPPCAGAVLRLAPCGRERTTKMSLPRGTARPACASRAVGVHDRYENPVRSKSYRRLQFWYIVYTLYAVYIVPCITILAVHMHVHVLSLPRQWNYGISTGGAACTVHVLEFHCICKLCHT